MLVRTVEERRAAGWEKVLNKGLSRSVRFVTAADRMGFSFHMNQRAPGRGRDLWYKNHWEANYIISGSGFLENLETGEDWPLRPGTLYTVGPRDRHSFTAESEIRMISVFCPAIKGSETHDDDGAYPPTGEIPPGREAMFVRTAEAMRAAGEELVIAGGTARSLRMLTKADGVGFSFSDVNLAAGAKSDLWYKNHWEANLTIGGEGVVTDRSSGESWPMRLGTMHIVGPEDRHTVEARTDLHVISVFCPALAGDEQHDADGALSASGPIPPGPPKD
jgi:L-ectoine synthase